MSSFQSETLEVEIESLSFGGDGVAKKDGLVYFVPFAAPGDFLKVKTTEKKKNFARAEILEILKPGPSRQKAPCPVYGKCGGCNWQHISYPEQLRQKQAIVKKQLGGFITDPKQLLEIVPSPSQFTYRNRIQLKFDGKKLGYYERQTHKVIGIERCEIAEKELNLALQKKSKALLSSGAEPNPKIELFLDIHNKVHESSEKEESDSVGFSQVNSGQNTNLVATTLEWMKAFSSNEVYDLYSGAGNFTFPILEAFPKAMVTAVELSEASVKLAHAQIKKANLSPKRIRFLLSDVSLFLKRQILGQGAIVLLDPPRVGCAPEVIDALAKQPIQRLFYISCNPASLSRDIERLQRSAPWRLVRAQPFDMFPQTDHVEVLAELSIDSQ